jgi:hypothetical protein
MAGIPINLRGAVVVVVPAVGRRRRCPVLVHELLIDKPEAFIHLPLSRAQLVTADV